MLNYLTEIAKQKGLEEFTAWLLTSNTKMLHVFKKSGYPIKYTVEDDLYHLVMELQQKT